MLATKAVKAAAGANLDVRIAMRHNNDSQMLITRFVLRQGEATRPDNRDEHAAPVLASDTVLASDVRLPSPGLVRNKNNVAGENHKGRRAKVTVGNHREGAGLSSAATHLPRPVHPQAAGVLPNGHPVEHGSHRVARTKRNLGSVVKRRRQTHTFPAKWLTLLDCTVNCSGAGFDYVSLLGDQPKKPTPQSTVHAVAPLTCPAELIAKQKGLKFDGAATKRVLERAKKKFITRILAKLLSVSNARKRLMADMYAAEQNGYIHNDPKYSYGFSQHFQVGAPLPRRGLRAPLPYFRSTVITADLVHTVLCDERPLNSLPSALMFLQLGARHK